MRHLLWLAVGLLTACSHTIYPQTSGSHAPAVAQALATGQKARFVVWATHPAVAQQITEILVADGHTVVERGRLQAVFNEQKIRLSHTPDEDVLRVGRLVGATQVIFAEVSPLERGIGLFATVPPVRVLVRSVDVESGTVLWSGSAAYAEPTVNPEQGAALLAVVAISRATCLVERGAVWEEYSAKGGGCRWPGKTEARR
jgi:hypothetical protein